MVTCPAGHDSATDDYCDTCGLAIAAPTAGSAAVAPAANPTPSAEPARPGVDTCAVCGAERPGRFCEECGHDSALPPPPRTTTVDAATDHPGTDHPAPPPGTGSRPRRDGAAERSGPLRAGPEPATGTWTAVVRADRAWFDEVRGCEGPDAAAVEFPRFCPDRRFTLSGTQVAIGRRNRSRGTDPEIDLSGPPLDPGVSAQHALLLARPGGGWDLVDLDSTNGTSIGGASEPIAAFTPVPLADGDRIRLGAWTTITVRRSDP